MKNVSKKGKKKTKLLDNLPLVKHQEDQKWYQYQVNYNVENPAEDKLSDEQTRELFDEAEVLLQEDVDLHNKLLRSQGGSEASWLQSAVKRGTASDRKTAMQLQMYKSPIHSLSYTETLISLLQKKSTREAIDVIPILEDVFLNHFLPPNRKLISFSSRPLAKIKLICSNSEQGRRRILVLWMFEHQLKIIYERFLKTLESLAAGVVEDLSKRSLRIALNLLAERPESEQFLLTMLVNKLGHPNYRVGSHVSTLLEELSRRQPNMRPVIVKEVERLVYRKNVSERAHLYSSTFLSQIMLRAGESDLAVHLLSIYFGLFNTLIARKKTDNRLLNILLAASNRAFPYAKEKAESLTEDINALYKVVHTGSFSVSLQTLKLLFQILNLNDSLSERYYTALYRKLFDPIPPSCYNQLLLLLFKTLKSDSIQNRVRTFVKRLLQVAVNGTPPVAAGILILVSRLAEERSSLIVLRKDFQNVAATTFIVDDDEEHYVDMDIDGKPIIHQNIKTEEPCDNLTKVKNIDGKKFNIEQLRTNNAEGWVHRKQIGGHGNKSPYNYSARNPLFIDCSNLVDTELVILSKHYHPSVAIFAKALLEKGRINYRGDPLEDFTQMKFLDRFAYKNPKEDAITTTARVARKKTYNAWGVKRLAVTSKEYLAKKPDELPADERFLHRFATLKFNSINNKANKEEEQWDIESVNSEEFDAIIDQFEPGEANDDFDADFSKEFTSEKQKKRVGDKRKAIVEDDEDDINMDDEDIDSYSENDDEDPEDAYMDEDGSNNSGDEEESDDQDESVLTRYRDADSNSSDEDAGDNDPDLAGDRFANMLEEFGDKKDRKSKFRKSR